MMRSPEQQFAMAKRLPMQELVKVLQGQSDSVDMSIAEMVLRQKTQAQKAMQGAQAMEMAQAPKVVEKDLMEAGVAAVPAPNMEQMDGYAGGGIVAFQPGGAVGAPLQSTRVPGPGPTFASAFPNAASTASRIPGLASRIGMALNPMLMFEAMTGPSEDEITRLREFDRAKAVLKEAGFTDKDISALKSPDVYRMATGYGYKPVTASVATPAAPAAPAAPTPSAPAAPPVSSASPEAATTSAEDSGIASLKSQISALRGRLTKPTMEGSAAEVEDMYKKAGISMDPFAEYKKSLGEEKAQSAADRREAGWLRVLEAGLGTLGGESPYGFVNIGKGSQAAAKGAMEDIKEFKKLDRERNRALGQIAVAENDLKRGVTDKKISRYDDAMQRYNAADMKLSELELGVNVEKFKLGQTRSLKVDEIALKEANDQLQKEMITDPMLARDPTKYRQRLNELYTGFKSALMGKGLGTTTTAVPSGVKVTREKK